MCIFFEGFITSHLLYIQILSLATFHKYSNKNARLLCVQTRGWVHLLQVIRITIKIMI